MDIEQMFPSLKKGSQPHLLEFFQNIESRRNEFRRVFVDDESWCHSCALGVFEQSCENVGWLQKKIDFIGHMSFYELFYEFWFMSLIEITMEVQYQNTGQPASDASRIACYKILAKILKNSLDKLFDFCYTLDLTSKEMYNLMDLVLPILLEYTRFSSYSWDESTQRGYLQYTAGIAPDCPIIMEFTPKV